MLSNFKVPVALTTSQSGIIQAKSFTPTILTSTLKLPSTNRERNPLVIIVVAQFLCTSLWFASNAIVPDLQSDLGLTTRAAGDLTSAIQLGFIVGTLTFALFSISDRFSPSTVFFVCSIIGAGLNLLILFSAGIGSLLAIRVLTGFCLAGIYPVGMKISSDYFEKGLGTALGFLVGALVIGTAFPHLIRLVTHELDWKYVVITTSVFAAIGGLLIHIFVPDGPFRKKGAPVDLSLAFKIFNDAKFRNAAFGYFGHMWELYTVWAFVPALITQYDGSFTPGEEKLWSFLVIASGGIACMISGFVAKKMGSARTALWALGISGCCCVLSSFSFSFPAPVFLAFLVVWGMMVVADSPQFSTLVARYAPRDATGTALTIVNSIGFAITIVSIQFLNALIDTVDFKIAFVFLAVGPALGLIATYRVSTTE